MNQALLSSKKMDWRTPPEILDLVRQVGPIGLDPCTSADNPTGARCYLTSHENGLEHTWDTIRGEVAFWNPPYGRSLRAWAAKAMVEGMGGAESIGLVPARTDTAWWANVKRAHAVCFWSGRIHFWDKHPETGEYGPAVHWSKKKQRWQKAPAPFPSALVYWGPRADRFAEVFGPHGWVVRP